MQITRATVTKLANFIHLTRHIITQTAQNKEMSNYYITLRLLIIDLRVQIQGTLLPVGETGHVDTGLICVTSNDILILTPDTARVIITISIDDE